MSIFCPPNTPFVDEVHPTTSPAERIFALNAGAFFTDGLVVRKPNGDILQPLVDWIAIWLYKDGVIQTGREVCAAMVIKNESVASVKVSYTAVGGEISEAATISAINDAVAALSLPDVSQIQWGRIVGIPPQLPPAAHLHHVSDWYGFNDALAVWEGIRVALVNGGVENGAIGAIYQYIDNQIAAKTASPDDIGDLNSAIAAAIAAHKVESVAHTKDKVGLALVDNFATATNSEAQAGVLTDKFVTPAGISARITQMVTKSFVGLGSVQNYGIADQAESEAGTVNNKYMTPLRVKQAILTLATKTTVGLGNLSNYQIASAGEAFAGVATNRYMSPERARQAAIGVFGGPQINDASTETIDTLLDPIFRVVTTVNGTSFPSGGTGTNAYIVMNIFVPGAYATVRDATTNRFQFAFSTNRKGLWRRFINGGVVTPNSWIDILDKGAIGLGSVNNYPMAALGDALAGTQVNTYASPSVARNAAQGLMRHVGVLTADPDSILTPVAVCQGVKCPTNVSSLDYYRIETLMLTANATDAVANSVNRYQIATGLASPGIYRRYYNGTDWSGWYSCEGAPIRLSATTDLDLVASNGIYIQTLSVTGYNHPVATPGVLTVRDYGGGFITQEYLAEGSTPVLKHTRRYTGSWSLWESTPVILSSQATAEIGVNNNFLMSPLRTNQLINARMADGTTALQPTNVTVLMSPQRTRELINSMKLPGEVVQSKYEETPTAGTWMNGEFPTFDVNGLPTDAALPNHAILATTITPTVGNKLRFTCIANVKSNNGFGFNNVIRGAIFLTNNTGGSAVAHEVIQVRDNDGNPGGFPWQGQIIVRHQRTVVAAGPQYVAFCVARASINQNPGSHCSLLVEEIKG